MIQKVECIDFVCFVFWKLTSGVLGQQSKSHGLIFFKQDDIHKQRGHYNIYIYIYIDIYEKKKVTMRDDKTILTKKNLKVWSIEKKRKWSLDPLEPLNFFILNPAGYFFLPHVMWIQNHGQYNLRSLPNSKSNYPHSTATPTKPLSMVMIWRNHQAQIRKTRKSIFLGAKKLNINGRTHTYNLRLDFQASSPILHCYVSYIDIIQRIICVSCMEDNTFDIRSEELFHLILGLRSMAWNKNSGVSISSKFKKKILLIPSSFFFLFFSFFSLATLFFILQPHCYL